VLLVPTPLWCIGFDTHWRRSTFGTPLRRLTVAAPLRFTFGTPLRRFSFGTPLRCCIVGTPLMALSCRCTVRDGIDPASLDAFKK